MKVTLLSKIFHPALRILPNNTKITSKSHELFLYCGLISPGYLGTFTIMPTLQRSLDKLIKIINDGMTCVNAQKITMPCLGRSSLWKASGRLSLMTDDVYKIFDKNGELILQPTHEEEVTNLLATYPPLSASNTPILLYQISTKFRNEAAPKNGLVRCREFLMKDLYSFDRDDESAHRTYQRVVEEYHHIFQQLNIDFQCVEAPCGGMGGSLSHEFHVISPIGEDVVLQCNKCKKGFNKELKSKTDDQDSLSCIDSSCSGTMKSYNAIEIGHCFMLGDRYTKSLNGTFLDADNKKSYFAMGCYGIGVTRLLSTCVEFLSKENKIRWPKKLVPYRVAILLQKDGAHDQGSMEFRTQIIEYMSSIFEKNSLCLSDIFIDDSNYTIGKKLTNADVIGIPWAIVVKDKEILETVDLYNNITYHFPIEEATAVVIRNESDKYYVKQYTSTA